MSGQRFERHRYRIYDNVKEKWYAFESIKEAYDMCKLLNEMQRKLDVYTVATLNFVGELADNNLIICGVEDE